MTSAKLATVSRSVMPICPGRSPFARSVLQQVTSFEGLLKIKESIQPSLAESSQRAKNKIRMTYCMTRTRILVCFCLRIYRSCALRLWLYKLIHLLP